MTKLDEIRELTKNLNIFFNNEVTNNVNRASLEPALASPGTKLSNEKFLKLKDKLNTMQDMVDEIINRIDN